MRVSCLFTVLLSVVFTLAATDGLAQSMAGSKVSGASPVRFLHRSPQGVEFRE